MWPAIAAGALTLGTIFSIAGQRSQARAQERAARENANAKRLEALELLDRFDINARSLVAEGARLRGQQTTSFINRGVDVGSGAP
jgi:triphosphoribosyl-dephospho-CoA synthetase